MEKPFVPVEDSIEDAVSPVPSEARVRGSQCSVCWVPNSIVHVVLVASCEQIQKLQA